MPCLGCIVAISGLKRLGKRPVYPTKKGILRAQNVGGIAATRTIGDLYVRVVNVLEEGIEGRGGGAINKVDLADYNKCPRNCRLVPQLRFSNFSALPSVLILHES